MSDSVNILLVDDEARNLDVLESFLKTQDYNLVRALNADQALLLLLEGEFAVIVLDIQMPEISGIELAKIIKERKRTQHIPIIFLTAYYQEDKDVLQGYGTGAVDYLTKPINPQILKSKIEVFVDLFRKTRALIKANSALESEVIQRQSVEAELHKANDELEARVLERTADLNRANQVLRDRERALKASEAQAKAASQAKDEFFAALSHELRTPLSPVLLLATESSNDQSLPEQVRADFQTIAKNVSLEARLIDDLLDLTRISHGKLKLERLPFDIHHTLEHAISLVGAEIANKKIELRLACEATVSSHVGDEVRLEQAFWNVINNAVKFSDPGGKISIATKNDDERNSIEISVSDSGIGMTQEEISKIFNPFTQGDHATQRGNRRFGGLGLGLAISQTMIRQHAGTIKAMSEGRNKGTTISIRLPVSHLTSPHGPNGKGNPESRSENSTVGDGLRVLLLEDHASTSSALKNLLSTRNYHVTATATIAEARGVAAAERFDILVSDLGLPDGNGCELMSELSQGSSIVGIALSGYGMGDDKKRTVSAGFSVHLTKPVTAQELDRALSLAQRIRNGEQLDASESGMGAIEDLWPTG